MNSTDHKYGALSHLRSVCGDAYWEQERLLERIIRKNSETEFGREHGFGEITGYNDYKKSVPVTSFADYEEYIARIIQGERDILTADPPVFYNISSGSTGFPKYFPLCAEDIAQQKMYFEDLPRDAIRKALPEEAENDLFGCIFNTGDVFMTEMPDGTPNGVRSGAYPQLAFKEGKLDCSVFTAPKEVLFPAVPQNMMYLKIRFALANENITAIHSIFVHRTIIMLEYILSNWAELIEDTEKGTVNPKFHVSREWQEYLAEHLPPAPERAAYLRTLSPDNLETGMLKKIWKKLKYIRLITGSSFADHTEKLKKYCEGIHIHSFVYGASEAVLGAVPYLDKSDEYVLTPDTCFFEFTDEDDPEHIVTMRDIEVGRRYGIIITTVSGLYRYDMGDIVEVVGKYGNAPAVKICYRRNMVLNLADEKLNTAQFESAMKDFAEKTGISATGCFVVGNHDHFPPRYELFIETESELNDGVPAVLDMCLCSNSVGYAGSRSLLEIGSPMISRLKPGTFRKYDEQLIREGLRTEQAKPLRIMTDGSKLKFFEKRKEETYYGKEISESQ